MYNSLKHQQRRNNIMAHHQTIRNKRDISINIAEKRGVTLYFRVLPPNDSGSCNINMHRYQAHHRRDCVAPVIDDCRAATR